jgi:hypothetical protein
VRDRVRVRARARARARTRVRVRVACRAEQHERPKVEHRLERLLRHIDNLAVMVAVLVTAPGEG